MKSRSIVMLLLAVLTVGLWGWLSQPPAKTELMIQGRTTRAWLHEVEIGGMPEQKNLAYETLISAGPKVVPDLSQILLAPESLNDLSLRLPSEIVPLDKKYNRANESATLTLKAQAAWVLGVIAYRYPDATEVQAAAPALTSSLRNGSPIVRYLSAQALGAMGQRASNAVNTLITRTTEDDSGLRMSAVEAIGRIGVNTPAVVAAITRALSDTNSDVRVTATQSLQRLQKNVPSHNPNP